MMRAIQFVCFILIFITLFVNPLDAQTQSVCSEIISVHCRDLPIRSVLSWIAAMGDKNIIIHPRVQGSIDLFLQSISIDQAIHVILQSQRLKSFVDKDVLYVGANEFLEGEKQSSLSMGQSSVWIQLKYVPAMEIFSLLKSKEMNILSSEGHISVNVQTNSLIVQDQLNRIQEVQKMIQKIDRPIPQIRIEAKIVNIDDDYENELGTRLGLTVGSHMSGSLKGATSEDVKDRLNVDLPVLSPKSGHLGLALLKLSHRSSLDLELSALEREGRAEIISSPTLLTANQQTAFIEAGEEIPYQESVAQGVTTTAFKKAVLSLQITPQVIGEHQMILNLKVNQDKRSNKEVLGVPAIDTRQLSTQILVRDGQTIVLGGTYEQTQTQSIDRIPFFSDLPLIGVLFKHRKRMNNHRELLIFVTPTIASNENIT